MYSLSFEWLNDYLDLTGLTEALADRMPRTGIEIRSS